MQSFLNQPITFGMLWFLLLSLYIVHILWTKIKGIYQKLGYIVMLRTFNRGSVFFSDPDNEAFQKYVNCLGHSMSKDSRIVVPYEIWKEILKVGYYTDIAEDYDDY